MTTPPSLVEDECSEHGPICHLFELILVIHANKLTYHAQVNMSYHKLTYHVQVNLFIAKMRTLYILGL
jgi:hypothetical protein